jgi:thiamine-phosphate diphosphorylase
VPHDFLLPAHFVLVSRLEPLKSSRCRKKWCRLSGSRSVYPTGTKPDAGPAVGPELIRQIRAHVRIPIFAIGGITLTNAKQVLAAGADGIAVISAVICSPNIADTTKKFVELMRE